MEKIILTVAMATTMAATSAQSLDHMQWFNEPEQWETKDGTLTMLVTPHSDYWRISHYGFTVDDAPFLYTTRGGEFEAKVKVSGEYIDWFDQVGMMAACPDADGFEAKFENFSVKHLPDIRRTEWLEKNK